MGKLSPRITRLNTINTLVVHVRERGTPNSTEESKPIQELKSLDSYGCRATSLTICSSLWSSMYGRFLQNSSMIVVAFIWMICEIRGYQASLKSWSSLTDDMFHDETWNQPFWNISVRAKRKSLWSDLVEAPIVTNFDVQSR